MMTKEQRQRGGRKTKEKEEEEEEKGKKEEEEEEKEDGTEEKEETEVGQRNGRGRDLCSCISTHSSTAGHVTSENQSELCGINRFIGRRMNN